MARLQLQEGRIDVVVRQLADVRSQHAVAVRKVNEALAALDDVDGALRRTAAEARGNLQDQRRYYADDLPRREQSEQRLRAQEAALAKLLMTQQEKWQRLHAQLDELERALAARAKG